MAAPKPIYGDAEEAKIFLASEGFVRIETATGEHWECDMTNDGGGKEVAVIEPKDGGYAIRSWHEDAV